MIKQTEYVNFEIEERNKKLLLALTVEQDLNEFLKDLADIKDAVALYPQHSDKLFKFMINNPDQYILTVTDLRDVARLFPQSTNELFDFTLKNLYEFVVNAWEMRALEEIFSSPQYIKRLLKSLLNITNRPLINLGRLVFVIENFPQYSEILRDLVFENSHLFMYNFYHLDWLIKLFPASAELLQKPVEALRNGFLSVHETDAAIEKVHEVIREFRESISHAEICKNAQVIAEGTLDNRVGTRFKFFQELPCSIGIEIAALTGTFKVHSQEDAEQIAQQKFSEVTSEGMVY
jgi:hypothetical protein